MASYHYTPRGTCSTSIDVTVEDGVVKNVSFTGGCNGNLQGISALVSGMPVEEVIRRLKGIRCGYKGTSCPDQLCCALEEMKKKVSPA
ncbi:MAG: TIGR03905 family TSCPD domain-containing protein [Paraprevotella sp.]|nr:TIGR03905 family TSCPD domain-containing protein [Paraprevotella sp.]